MTLEWLGKWEVESESDPDKKYIVSVSNSGIWGCSCWAWKAQRRSFENRKDCKHILKIRKMVGDL